MDKKNRKHTIKVKLNETNQNNQKAHKKQKAQKPAENKQDPIHIAQKETAAANQGGQAAEENQANGEFPWFIPEPSDKKRGVNKKVTFSSDKAEESPIFVGQPKNLKKKTRTRNWRHVLQFLIAAGIAIIIGLGFTFIVLKITTAEEAKPAAMPASAGEAGDSGQKMAGDALIEPLQVTAVQGGVFSSREAAAQQSEQFNQQGIPATVLETGNSFYILLFASDTIENAKAISSYFKEQGTDAFWKDFVIENQEKKMSTENAELIGQLNQLYEGLAKNASAIMLSSSGGIEEELKSGADAIKKESIADPELKKLAAGLVEAVEAEPSDDPKGTALSMQKSILEYISGLNEYIR